MYRCGLCGRYVGESWLCPSTKSIFRSLRQCFANQDSPWPQTVNWSSRPSVKYRYREWQLSQHCERHCWYHSYPRRCAAMSLGTFGLCDRLTEPSVRFLSRPNTRYKQYTKPPCPVSAMFIQPSGLADMAISSSLRGDMRDLVVKLCTGQCSLPSIPSLLAKG